MHKLKGLLFISLLFSLTFAACSGRGEKDNVQDDTPASSDTIAMLRKVETLYAADERPDSAVLSMRSTHLNI